MTQLAERLEKDYPTLYAHPSGAVLDYDRKDGTLTLHDPDDREFMSISIGAIGLIEMGAACARLGAELLEVQP